MIHYDTLMLWTTERLPLCKWLAKNKRVSETFKVEYSLQESMLS